ncbi:hypothetical protein [Gloeothece citriformis]|nr:hypothetical protein [Gloeothece citriformis]
MDYIINIKQENNYLLPVKTMAHIQISDLINQAVDNATERRNRGIKKAGLSDLSPQEMNQINGGKLSEVYRIILGLFFD